MMRQRGFTYLGLLLFIAASGAAIAATLEVWHTTVRRDKEAELLFVGNQYRQALAGYYSAPGVARRYPKSLDELVMDTRFPEPKRWLRKIYPDPMTGQSEWGLQTLPDGQITGVYSLSDLEPLKTRGFLARDKSFEDKTRYSEWIFKSAVRPTATKPATAPGDLPPSRTTPRTVPGRGR